MTGTPLRNADLARRAAAFVERGVLSEDDLLIVDAVAPRWGEADAEALLGLAFAVRAPRAGHAGVDLRDLRETVAAETVDPEADPLPEAAWPADPAAWEAAVLASPLVERATAEGLQPGRTTPFLAQDIGGGRVLVLTRRMAREQARTAASLRARVASPPAVVVEDAAVRARLEALGIDPEDETGRGIRLALARTLSIVTGGPGTGKTWSVARLLAVLLALWPEDERPRVVLAAPTGKAAARMDEVLREEVGGIEGAAHAFAGLARAGTIHRIIGLRPDGSARHDRERPVPADVVIVDEASMIDLRLMRRLAEAVAPGARLLLLGDPQQLASVEAGTVLADLVRAAEGPGPLAGCLARRTVNYRQKDAPDVARAADAMRAGDVEAAVAAMTRPAGGVAHRPLEGAPDDAVLDELARPWIEAEDASAGPSLRDAVLAGRAAGWSKPARRAVLESVDGYRVLAVHRRGRRGVAALDAALGNRLRAALQEAGVGARWLAGRYWLGRPLLVTRNTPELGVMNGDVGVVLPGADGEPAAFFLAAGDRLVEVPTGRLPPHEGALAMTVHKSQGSQFHHVALVLADRPSPIQTRELIYTALTRARRRVTWWGTVPVLRAALARTVQRASGLAAMLAEPEP